VREGAIAPPVVPALTASDLDVLAKMDVVLRAVRTSKPDPARFDVAEKDPAKIAAAHDLVAKSLGAMHTMATFGALSQESQQHPDVQRRMWAALPDVHEATMGMTDQLDSVTAEERRKIDERLRKDPDLPMRIIERIDEQAKQSDIPHAQRLRMRTIATHLAWRLKTQGSGALIDELVGKVDRVIARHGADAELQRAVAAKVAEAQLFGFPTEPGENPQVEGAEETGPLRARFRTSATRDAVGRVACSLQAKIVVDGKQRPIDLRIDNQMCGAETEGSIHGNVHVQDGEVTLELVPPDDVSPGGRGEIRSALRDVGGELRRRVVGLERPAPSPSEPSSIAPPDEEPPKKKRTSAKVLMVSAILWGAGFVVAGVGGIALALAKDDGGVIAFGLVSLTVASLLALGGIVTLIIAGALYAGDN
jgi:hypothetical protein